MKTGLVTPLLYFLLQLIIFYQVCSSFDGECAQDDIEIPAYHLVCGHSYNASLPSYEECITCCNSFSMIVSATEAASYCFCTETYAAGATETLCSNSSCVDGSDCGGWDGLAILQLHDGTVIPEPPKYIHLSVLTNEALVNEAVGIDVNSSTDMNYASAFGDRSGVQDAGSYQLPGTYKITARDLDDSAYSDLGSVTIHGTPELGVVCPSLLALNETGICNASYNDQGQGRLATYTLTKPSGDVTWTSYIPGQDTSVIGGTAASPVDTTDLSSDLLAIQDSKSQSVRYLTRVRGTFEAAGDISVYGLTPSCMDNSLVYCGRIDTCSADTCSLEQDEAFSCSTSFCSLSGSCGGGAVCTEHVELTPTYTATLLGTIPHSGSAVDEDLSLSGNVIVVPEGQIIAIGSDAAVSHRTAEIYEESDLIFSGGNLVDSGLIHDVQFVVAGHRNIDLGQEIICEENAPILNANVADLTAEATVQHLNEGTFYFNMEVQDSFSSVTVQNSTMILCQEEIIEPTLSSASIWIALGDTDTLTLEFAVQGSPIYASVNVDGDQLFHYHDDAKASAFVWDIPLAYASSGYYNFTGNATNLLGTVQFNADIHILPPVTETWQMSCFSTDDVTVPHCYTGFDCTCSWVFPEAANPPFNATFNASLLNGTVIFEEFRPFGTVDEAGAPKSLEVTHVFNWDEAGVYPIQTFIENEVSNDTITGELTMIQSIEGLHMNMTWNSTENAYATLLGVNEDSVMVNNEITIAPWTEKGTPDKYTVTLTHPDGTNTTFTSTGENITLTLPKEGEYTVTIEAENDIQTITYSTKLFAIDRIRNPVLYGQDISKPEEVTNFNFGFDAFPMIGASLIVNLDNDGPNSTMLCFGDEDMCLLPKYNHTIYSGPVPSTSPLSINFTYPEMGVYNVTAKAIDKYGEINLDLTVTVADIPCLRPDVTIEDPFPYPDYSEENFYSNSFFKKGIFVIECNATLESQLLWRVHGVELNGTYAYQNDDDWPFDEAVVSSANLLIDKKILPYGHYKLIFCLKIIAIPNVIYIEDCDSTYLLVTSTPLIPAMVEGGIEQMAKGFGHQALLQPGIHTIDPDSDDPDFSCVWFCKESESAPFVTDENGTIVHDTEPQNIPDAKVAIEEGRTGGGCFGEGDGLLNHTGCTLDLDTSSFVKQDGLFEIIAEVHEGDRVAITSIVLDISKKPPPSVGATCGKCISRDGSFYVNIGQIFDVAGTCEDFCEDSDITNFEITDSNGLPVNEGGDPCITPPDGGIIENCDSAFRSTKDGKDVVFSESFLDLNSDHDEFNVRYVHGSSPPGYAQFKVLRNDPPEHGSCTLDKDSGYSLVDEFQVSCSNWVDPEGHGIKSYVYFYEDNGKEIILAAGSTPSAKLILPEGTISIKAKIIDELGGETIVSAGDATVAPPTDEQLDNFDLAAIMNDYQEQGESDLALQVLNAYNSYQKNSIELDTTANITSIEEIDEEVYDQLVNLGQQNEDKVDTLSAMPVTSVEAGEQIVSQIGQMFSISDDPNVQKLLFGSEGKNKSITLLQDTMNAMNELDMTVAQTEKILPGVMDATGAINMMDAELLTGPKAAPLIDVQNAEYVASDWTISEDTELSDSLLGQSTDSALEVARSTSKENELTIDKMYFDVSNKLLEDIVVGQPVEVTSDNGAVFHVRKMIELQIFTEGLTVSVGGAGAHASKVIFKKGCCPTKQIIHNTDCNHDIGLFIAISPHLRYLTDATIHKLTKASDIVQVTIIYEGQEIEITDEGVCEIEVTTPIRYLDWPQAGKIDFKEDKNKFLPFVYMPIEVVHDHCFITVEIRVNGNIPNGAVVFIRLEGLPTEDEFLVYRLVKNFRRDPDGVYKWLFTKDTGIKGKYYVGLAILKSSSSDGKKRFSREDFEANVDLNVEMKLYCSSCLYYDKYLEKWNIDGLAIVDASPNKTSCHSSHLTAFGTGFFPAPNSLDFTFIFANAGFLDNLTLYVFLIVMACLYIIMMLWAHWMDRKDDERRGVTPFPDNKPEDKYLYEISFHTGFDQHATTESQPVIFVSGHLSETGGRLMPVPTDHRYRRSGVDLFVMSTPYPLGFINLIRIVIDNSGEPPLDSWQLYMVEILDLITLDKYKFYINDWLGLDRLDGKADKTFYTNPIASDEEEFSRKLYYQANKSTNQDHVFMSMFSRPVHSRYGRKERVTICTAFLFLQMLVSVAWYQTSLDFENDAIFSLGPFSLTSESALTGILILVIVYPFTYLVSLIFKRARPRNLLRCRAIDAIERQRNRQLLKKGLSFSNAEIKSQVETTGDTPRVKEFSPVACIPWWTRIIGWLLLLGAIGGSIFIIWSYGIMFGESKTVKCFSAFILALFLAIIVIQWINILCCSCLSTLFCRGYFSTEDANCDEEVPVIKDQPWPYMRNSVYGKRWIDQVEGVDEFNPATDALRTRLSKDREMKGIMKTLIFYLIFLAIITIIVSFKIGPDFFHLQNHLRKTFIKEGHIEYDFSSKVKTADDWWLWCKKVMMQELRASSYYNGKAANDLIGYLNDWQNRMMGYAILRLVRSKPNIWKPPDLFKQYILRSSGVRGIENEDSQDYCAGWIRNESFSGSCSVPEFKFRTSEQVGAIGGTARLGSYSGGGYVFLLNKKKKDIFDKIELLQKNKWINKNTRAVFLEFSVYNVNLNLFATCQVVAEFTEGGGIIPYWRFDTLKLSRDPGFWGNVNTICEILFVIAICFFTANELWKMKNEKCAYFSSYWNLAELLILFVSYTLIGLYFYRDSLTQEALDKFYAKGGNVYVRIDSAALVEQFYLYLLAVIQFFSYVKLIKFLQFNNRMNMLALTIKGCWDELKVFFIAFGLVFFAFSTLFYFMFIWYLEEFSSIFKAIQTSFKMMMGKFDFQAMKAANALSPLLFFVFSVFNSMILINIMLTMILQSFKTVKSAMEGKENRLNVVDYVWRVFKERIRYQRRNRAHVKPKLTLKDQLDQVERENDVHHYQELPGKVSHVINHINRMYFDGKLDLHDPDCQQNLQHLVKAKYPEEEEATQKFFQAN